MKYLTVKIFLVLLLLSVACSYAQQTVTYFTAKSDGGNVKVEWASANESDVNHYSLQRKSPGTSFIEIASIPPKGNNSYYTYEDQSLYKAQDVLFTYILVTINKSRANESTSSVSVSPNISGIKRTWGSIKAMFR
jgi:hypothetical protein